MFKKLKSRNIWFLWVPENRGLRDNKEADRIARLAVTWDRLYQEVVTES